MILRAYFGNGNAASELADLAARLWGGATILNGMGRYVDDDDILHSEIAWIVEVLAGDSQEVLPITSFRGLVQKVLNDSSEETVLITWSDQVSETLKNRSLANVGS